MIRYLTNCDFGKKFEIYFKNLECRRWNTRSFQSIWRGKLWTFNKWNLCTQQKETSLGSYIYLLFPWCITCWHLVKASIYVVSVLHSRTENGAVSHTNLAHLGTYVVYFWKRGISWYVKRVCKMSKKSQDKAGCTLDRVPKIQFSFETHHKCYIFSNLIYS